MSVVAAYVYKNGARVREISLDKDDALAVKPGEFVWIGLYEPSEAELDRLRARFKLHPLAIEDALNAHQRPKVEIYGRELFVVARTAQLVDAQIAYGETAIFVGEGHLITVRHGSARAHTELRDQLEASPTLLAKGSDYVLHAVLDFVVDGYLPIIQALEDEVLDIERRTLEAFLSHGEVKRLFHLRRDLIRFKRVLSPMAEVCGRLEHLETPCLDDDVRPYFRDVLDHTQKVEGMVDALREVITSVFEAASLLEQQRQSAITRKLAAWAAILAVPTAVAGIYGMNFEHMPELHWVWGYPAVMVGIVGVVGWLYWRFKKNEWL
ncbi:magnesium/cobalt transporter CorA [Caulobacter rhizosphaerae]|jgi:magnesium transporter|uniref:Magnesium transport protein CorA n=1 Tax=Caulobacter rhizosphaerae TaxID=2010972 RepID=A0ABU1MZD8_9CAUL|nr:magnesium/cobalt transporter CorA [Caulobacter rhizosphaerae]MDR6531534.1 magnesium transporter [Caulobacter rhizosphaerae]